ncbi:MAG: hypothetical protein GF331_13530 [Chitinivibrionales bacterium]|nr:hypothetical protein [Chitinivibrionales bacterium]
MIAQRLSVYVAAALLVIAAGCGSNKLKKGDLLITTEEMRVSGESVWDDGTTEAFTRDIPPETVFRVLYEQRAGLEIIEVHPIRVEGNKDPDFITQYFLPPHLRDRYGLKGFSVTLDLGGYGTAFKRVMPKK